MGEDIIDNSMFTCNQFRDSFIANERSELPFQRDPDVKYGLLNAMRQSLFKEMHRIEVPINFNEPMSAL